MTKANDIGLRLAHERYSKGLGPFPTRAEYTAAITASLRKRGIPHATPHYDETGRCLTCGEYDRCPGVHTLKEIQDANH